MYFIQQTLKDKLLSEIGNRPYTILIDETTDESNIIQMDLHIRSSRSLKPIVVPILETDPFLKRLQI